MESIGRSDHERSDWQPLVLSSAVDADGNKPPAIVGLQEQAGEEDLVADAEHKLLSNRRRK